MKIGILALQGAVEPHTLKLRALGAEPVEVRTPPDLKGLFGIILPGGESTAMIHLLKLNQLWEPLAQFIQQKPCWGVCAGAILLARDVDHPKQASFSQLNLKAVRNAFGRQLDSFIGELEASDSWKREVSAEPFEGVFIRAPRFEELGKELQVLASWKGEPVFVRSGFTLASSFHPELSESNHVHNYFLSLCRSQNSNA